MLQLIAQITPDAAVQPPIWLRLLVLIVACVIVMAMSGRIVRFFVGSPEAPGDTSAEPRARFDPSAVIGKCENILTVILVMSDELAALGLIFAAKSIVRSDAIKNRPGFYLGGTLVNLVWGLIIATIARLLLLGR